MSVSDTDQSFVIGVFEDRQAVAQAIRALLKAGFQDEQIGFAARGYHSPTTDETPAEGSAIGRGIVGGILGAADMLLVPITGPADANAILTTVLPATEETLDRLSHKQSHPLAQTEPAQDHPTHIHEHPSSIVEQAHQPLDPNAEEQKRTSIVTGGVIGGVIGAAAALLIPGIGAAVAGGILVAVLGGTAFGGVAGGFLGAFTEMGVPKEQAHYYEQEVKAGHTILTVKTADRQYEVMTLLREFGAHDVQKH